MNRTLTTLPLTVLYLSASLAAAQEALYAPAPPAGSAFIRVASVNASAPITLDGRALSGKQVARTVSPYTVVKQGEHTVKLGASTLKLNVTGGTYVTLVAQSGKLRALPAEQPGGVTKARVTLYNLSDAPASLTTADGGTRLLDGVAPGTQKSLSVNAVTAALGVMGDGNRVLQAFPTEALKAGASYSAFVFGSGGARTAAWVAPTVK
ncbi:alginate O-acetyltransferase AlgF [Deinococcus aquaticus]|uniref:alginate O-acetyltransferase AlgF n=1 Tax=Deinococcus aquaticus TaxID=328692 RepID=UPI003F468715